MSLKICQIRNGCVSPLNALGLGVSFGVPNTSCSKQCFSHIRNLFAGFGIRYGTYAASGDPKFSLSTFWTYFQKYNFWDIFFCKNKCSFRNKYRFFCVISSFIYVINMDFYIINNEAITLARKVYTRTRHIIICLFNCLNHWQVHKKDGSFSFQLETTQELGAA
ncbi:hypothetical protein CFR77_05480 [Komagataeibacter sucrofermentans]|uniref:Uncharacterized protein n=1 Tax=Komagataeibacter sucrofermentans TaxID=1053551 RepID=A0A318QRK5_9PROT|nr:hypothetical protein CFR77_05480 [Komagataeibacter sucrofermentans]